MPHLFTHAHTHAYTHAYTHIHKKETRFGRAEYILVGTLELQY